ncbi:hypothetical protein SPBR_09148 [Sporothrix brasiliensis 5110]|uniref:Uncharacterized protein n=1 Tax=Sporothrix brasiliensis 5110 TaxID=1398154 RepID=A0A0C2IT50_9PEZI|nr:uncharacterized protein SPBR_09148 [Sporothrix brasiliensis 5110]KIH92226.1 hypothetical protein SPBR_09148 [Sporothrix brasiliensis 5110]
MAIGPTNPDLAPFGADKTERHGREAQSLAKLVVEQLASAGTIPATNDEELNIVSWLSYGPMDLRTTKENLQAGFIQDLYALST